MFPLHSPSLPHVSISSRSVKYPPTHPIVMVVPGGTAVVSVVRTIVLGGRDGGGQGTVVGRVVNEMVKRIYIHVL